MGYFIIINLGHLMNKPLRIALFGFGRIGRNIFRIGFNNPLFEFVAISDLGQPESMHYLLMRDSIHGTMSDEIKLDSMVKTYLTIRDEREKLAREHDMKDRELANEWEDELVKEDDEKITSLENQMQDVLKALAPLTEMLNQKEVKIPMSNFPKEVQEKLQQKLNHN